MNTKIKKLIYDFNISRRRRALLHRRELAVAGNRYKRIETRLSQFALSPKPLLVVGVLMIALQPILVSNINSAGAASNPALALTGYIWENEDGSSPDTVSQLAAGDGTIEAPWGGRVNLRAQLKNTGDALSGTDVGLFYDKGDGFWNKVNSSDTKTNAYSLPIVATIDSSSDYGQRLDVAIDGNGKTWVSYYDNGSKNLRVAEYVGSSGSGCTSAEWTCTTIESTGTIGYTTSIAIDNDNNPWVAYYDDTNDNLEVAEYVGSGGTGCDTAAWDCDTIDSTDSVGNYPSIAFDSKGDPWIAYQDLTAEDINIAKYVGSGGTGCAISSWDCDYIDNSVGDATVFTSSLAFGKNGEAWVSFADDGDKDGNATATIAEYVGSGGAGCTGSTDWDCTELYTGYAGGASSVAIDNSGDPWVSFVDGAGSSGDNLVVARYVGSSGTGCSGGLTSWTCELVEDTPVRTGTTESTARSNVNSVTLTADNFDIHDELFFDNTGTDYYATIIVDNGDGTYKLSDTISHDASLSVTNVKYDLGVYTSLAFDNDGDAWVAHRDSTNGKARVAKYVGSGGTDCYGSISTWSCTHVSLSDGDDEGSYIQIAFDDKNNAWIPHYNINESALVLSQMSDWSTGSGCLNNSYAAMWECGDIITSGGKGRQQDMALDNSGVPWISYYNSSSGYLDIAKYVGSGGTGCASDAWQCESIENKGYTNGDTSIAFDSGGTPWVSYNHNSTAGDLYVAHYVGSGGSCTNTAWDCDAVDTSAELDENTGGSTSIAIDHSGVAWVSYLDVATGTLKVANFVGSGGSGCNDSAWTCTTVESANDNGRGSSIAISPDDEAWVSFYSAGGTPEQELQVAKYVGSGGSGCDSSAWTCSDVFTRDLTNHTEIMFDASGKAWIGFKEAGTYHNFKVAKYVGSGGSGCYGGATDWDCLVIDSAYGMGQGSSIAMSPDGNPWFTYQDETNGFIKVAQYVGAGGSGCGSGDAQWSCRHLIGGIGGGNIHSSMAFDESGNVWITYYESSGIDLKYIKLSRSGEILLAPAQRYANGASVSESHADMTTTTDTTNRDDLDCIGGGSFEDGIYINSNTGSGLSMLEGITTAQCTEVVFTLDLSQAEVGDNYRFMIATKDSWDSNKSVWRGLSGGGNPPALTVTDVSMITGKDNGVRLPDCDTDTDWGCAELDDGDTGDLQYPKITIDSEGNPWATWEDEVTDAMVVANYVGSGGTGCSTTAWHCETVAWVGPAGGFTSIAAGEDGTVWTSFYDSTTGTLRAAHYVASGGNCNDSEFTNSGAITGSTAWQCEEVDDPSNNVGARSDIAIDSEGNPWISYHDQTASARDLKVARWIGGGNGNCGSASTKDWMCETIDDTGESGRYSSIAISDDNNVWIMHHDHGNNGNDNLRIAHYVGTGGDCTSDAWDCEIIDDMAGEYGGIAIDHDGNPWVSYRDNVGDDLAVANYVGSGGNCDDINTTGSDAWSCVEVDTTAGTAYQTSIAIAPDGNPWVSYSGSGGDLEVATYVGSGGDCTSSAWTCSTIETTNTVGEMPQIAFDYSGNAWVVSKDDTNNTIRIAKTHRPLVAPTIYTNQRVKGKNGTNGFARYLSTFGKSNASNPGICNGISDYYGACGLFHASGDYDTITAQYATSNWSESPYWTFAQSYDSNSELPTAQWEGTTTLAPNTSGTTGDIVLQVYRYGTINAWEDVASDATSGSCSTANCRLEGAPTGTASEYFNSKDGKYWVNFRLYQEPSTSSSITFKTDQFKAVTNEQRSRHGGFTLDGYKRPINWR